MNYFKFKSNFFIFFRFFTFIRYRLFVLFFRFKVHFIKLVQIFEKKVVEKWQ